MPSSPFLFDAVVFDLDGTLVATDRFWVDAARAGARRAFKELGIEHSMPSAAQWMGLVGHPIGPGFARLFSDLPDASRKRIQAVCEEEEHKALKSGNAALLPGVAETLSVLRDRGVRLGVASNCGQDYLDAMMHGLGLARWIEEARCLDSPGTSNKALMVGDLLDTFGTRAAVMVGDRLGDRDAAWENGLPHVHYVRGFAEAGEEVPCEASIEEMGELVPRLEKRTAWIEGALRRIGVLGENGAPNGTPAGTHAAASIGDRNVASIGDRNAIPNGDRNAASTGDRSAAPSEDRNAAPSGPKVVGITGHTGSGKSLFARDCARVIEAHGRKASVLGLDEFLRKGVTAEDMASTGFWAAERPLDQLERAFDVDRLIAMVIEPLRAGRRVTIERGGAKVDVPPDAVLVVQGLFLLHPRVRPVIDRVIHLEVKEAQSLRRIAGRDARQRGPEGLLAVRRHFLPTQRAFDEVVKPTEHADLVLDAENLLGPG